MLVIENIARIAHEANRAYCAAHADYSHVSWEQTPPILRDSIVSGVMEKIANPGITPEESHDLWLDGKINYGWKYGEEKSIENKTHPCMVPYEELSPEHRVKDHLLTSIVTAVMSVESEMSMEAKRVVDEYLPPVGD